MIDAIVGAVIMVVATTSLVYSIEVAVKAFEEAGRYDLVPYERKLLEDSGLDEKEIQDFYSEHINIDKSRMQWGEFVE